MSDTLEVQIVFLGISKGVKGSATNVSSEFQENFKNFQECFIEVLFCNFVVARHSLQLPEQKEDLFACDPLMYQVTNAI